MNDDDDHTIKSNDDYRRVLATANKLESIQANLDSVIDFFLAPIVKLYSKLCNDCLKLLFECDFKLDQFRKAEELVWRRVYHDIYRFKKTRRQIIRRADETFIESHFVAGIGFYSSLIIKLRSHYDIHDTLGIISPLNLTLGPIDNLRNNKHLNHHEVQANDQRNTTPTKYNPTTTVPENKSNSLAKQWARQAIYRSLNYMGDLARYLLETSQHDYRKLAFEFYKSASRFQPDHGLPFNQLATLAGSLNHNLDAVCSYMRCCLRAKPFEGAEGNMRKIFDLNKRSMEEIRETPGVVTAAMVSASVEPSIAAESLVRSTIVIFIQLVSNLWTCLTNPSNANNIQDQILDDTRLFFSSLCESIKLDPVVLFGSIPEHESEFQPISGCQNHSEKPRYISPTIMYEFSSISLMLIAKCQRYRSDDSETQINGVSKFVQLKDLVNTLALNLLHYTTSSCQRVMNKILHDLRVSRMDPDTVRLTPGSKPSLRTTHDANSFAGLPQIQLLHNSGLTQPIESNNRRIQSRLRQRKAATNYSNSVDKYRLNSFNCNEDSDLSDLEETALSTIDALEISSGVSEEPDGDANDLIDLCSSSDDNLLDSMSNRFSSSRGKQITRPRSSRPVLRSTRSQNYELERTLNLGASTSSLPMPDLLTGDFREQLANNITNNSQSPSGSSLGGGGSRNPLVDSEKSIEGSSRSSQTLSISSIYSMIYNQTYLPTIKVYFDWMLSDSAIISSNLQSFHSYKESLIGLVAILDELKETLMDHRSLSSNASANDKKNMGQEEDSSIYKHHFDGPEWIQKFPLSCDFPLIGLEPINGVHELNIDFKCAQDLRCSEAGFITSQCIVAFSHALTVFLENTKQ